MNVVPICDGEKGLWLYIASPVVRSVEAWSNLDGDTDCGIVVDSVTPEAVTAKDINGTA